MDSTAGKLKNLGNQSTEEKLRIAKERYDNLLTKLDKLHPKVVSDFKNVPDIYKRLYLDVHAADKVPVAKNIKLCCLDCCCWQKEEIIHCTVRQCGLWAIRPYQQKD